MGFVSMRSLLLCWGTFINGQEPAWAIAKIAGIAALLTVFTDTFFF